MKTRITRTKQVARKASVTLEDGFVIIKLPFVTEGKPSSTGKTNIHGATHGPRRVLQETANGMEPVIINNGYLKAIASVFAAPDSLDNSQNDSTN